MASPSSTGSKQGRLAPTVPFTAADVAGLQVLQATVDIDWPALDPAARQTIEAFVKRHPQLAHAVMVEAAMPTAPSPRPWQQEQQKVPDLVPGLWPHSAPATPSSAGGRRRLSNAASSAMSPPSPIDDLSAYGTLPPTPRGLPTRSLLLKHSHTVAEWERERMGAAGGRRMGDDAGYSSSASSTSTEGSDSGSASDATTVAPASLDRGTPRTLGAGVDEQQRLSQRRARAVRRWKRHMRAAIQDEQEIRDAELAMLALSLHDGRGRGGPRESYSPAHDDGLTNPLVLSTSMMMSGAVGDGPDPQDRLARQGAPIQPEGQGGRPGGKAGDAAEPVAGGVQGDLIDVRDETPPDRASRHALGGTVQTGPAEKVKRKHRQRYNSSRKGRI